ncbi:hypothetical protein Tcan_00370 [Toxocara canis]|uniref:Uncharacterized protein n=1 Tax=Toxocara canis TaxID=6265 RepID=A0A0B2VRZ5_TOXCA|nr:hypothetical protein Tcan_00370 [Toxocara canis]
MKLPWIKVWRSIMPSYLSCLNNTDVPYSGLVKWKRAAMCLWWSGRRKRRYFVALCRQALHVPCRFRSRSALGHRPLPTHRHYRPHRRSHRDRKRRRFRQVEKNRRREKTLCDDRAHVVEEKYYPYLENFLFLHAVTVAH